MKKKLQLFCIFIALAFSLCACSGKGAEKDVTLSENAEEDSVDKGTSSMRENKFSTPGDNVILKEYETINFLDTISLDFVNITIDGASYGDEIQFRDSEGEVYYIANNISGEKYVYVYGTIENMTGGFIDLNSLSMYYTVTFDNDYDNCYDGNIVLDGIADNRFRARVYSLQSTKFYIYVSVPDGLYESFNKMEVKFGFKENLETNDLSVLGYWPELKERDCDYLYSITVSK